MARTRTDAIGPAARPVAVPNDVDDPSIEKATGIVELPFHVRWSDPPMRYDLGSRSDRTRVYEQVLREGTDADVRRYIDVDALLDMWSEIVLPIPVRRAWATWFRKNRAVELEC